MPNLDRDAVKALADEMFPRSRTSRQALMEALPRLDEIVASVREDSIEAPALAPLAKHVVFVLSGQQINGDDRRAMFSDLNRIADAAAPAKLHIVTAGRMNLEFEAMRWAKARGHHLTEVAAVWAIPQPDGSTARDGNARRTRNRLLTGLCRASIARGCRVFVARYGIERSNDAVEGELVRAGARPKATSRYATQTPQGVRSIERAIETTEESAEPTPEKPSTPEEEFAILVENGVVEEPGDTPDTEPTEDTPSEDAATA